MRKRSASESNQRRSSSHSISSGKFRKVHSASNLKRRRRQSQNSIESVPRISRNFGSTVKNKANLPSILNDWKIIVDSMKENKNSSTEACSSTSSVQEKTVKKNPKDFLPIRATNGISNKKSEGYKQGSPLKNKVKSNLHLKSNKESEPTTKPKSHHNNSFAESNIPSEVMGIPKEISSVEVVQKPVYNSETFIEADTETCLPTPTSMNGFSSPNAHDSIKEKEEESDFVGFISPCHKQMDCEETTQAHASLPTPPHIDVLQENASHCMNDHSHAHVSKIPNASTRSLFSSSSSDEESFSGFESDSCDTISCDRCGLLFNNRASLFHHVKFGHRRIYSCVFDYGQCGQFNGSIALHQHLMESHMVLYDFMAKYFIIDMKSNKVSQFSEYERPCSVCRMVLLQPQHAFHELCVHGIWPKSVVNLGLVFIDQLINLWWTGRTLTYSCFVCYTNKKSMEYHVSSVAGFPLSVQEHLATHGIVIPTLQGWWLLVRLLNSVDVVFRTILNSLLCIGTEGLHSTCFVCRNKLRAVKKSNLKFSDSICSACEVVILKKDVCWFGCGKLGSSENLLLDHFITEHPLRLNQSSFCIKCGNCVDNLYVHIRTCESKSKHCAFCSEPLDQFSEIDLIFHSFSKHAYQCPIAGCMIPMADGKHPSFHKVLPSMQASSVHLFTKHLPTLQNVGVYQISSMLMGEEMGQVQLQSTTLSGAWIGMKNTKYHLLNGVLTPFQFVSTDIKCSLCKIVENVEIYKSTKYVSSICKNCTYGFSSCAVQDITTQCPVYKCVYQVSSELDLLNHLVQKHQLTDEVEEQLSCEHCKKNSNQISFVSRLGLMAHKLLKHRYACLICPEYFPSDRDVTQHRYEKHPISMQVSSSSLWSFSPFFRRKREMGSRIGSLSNNRPGICSVWSSDQNVYSLWEASMSDIQIDPPKTTEVSSMSFNQADDWCSSLCTISMKANSAQHASDGLTVKNEMEEATASATDLGVDTDLLAPVVGVDDDQTLDHPSSPIKETVENPSASPNFSPVKSFPSHSSVDAVSKSKKRKMAKGLGENACIDEVRVGNNIQIDLEQKFISTCTACRISVSLLNLGQHIDEYHPDSEVRCFCGYTGSLCSYLVHSFHMSHSPCESSPIALAKRGETKNSALIVLERRSKIGSGSSSKFPCYNCNKNFSTEKSRQLHYNLCKLEKKFECETCSQTFGLEAHLKKHIEWKHNHQNCELCGKEFTSKSSLHQHMIHIHKREVNQKCKHCPETFATLAQLKAHLREHDSAVSIASPAPSHTVSSPAPSLSSVLNTSTGTPVRRKRQPNKFTDDFIYTDSPSINLSRFNVKPPKISDDTDTDAGVKPSPVRKRKSTTKKSSKALKLSKSTNYEKNSSGVALPSLRPEIKQKDLAKIGKDCSPCKQEFDAPVAKLLHMYLLHPAMVLSMGFRQCVFCTYKFSSPDDVSDHHLDRHQRQFKSDGKFSCLCGIEFKEDGAYYFHLYYAHKAQRALSVGGHIICRVCPHRQKLDKIVDLVVHLSDRHTMFDHVRYNDSYMCNFCYKAFESFTVLSLHFFMVHKASKLQNLSYDCPYCLGASPWHSLEALQYHLDGFHGGLNNAQTVPVSSRSIYAPAPVPVSPTKAQYPRVPGIKIKKLIPPIKSPPPSNETLYCICRCPYDEVSDMIGCDNKNCRYQWFHFECVGILAAPEGNWFCPDCESMSQHTSSKSDNSYAAPIKLSFVNKGLSQSMSQSPSSSSSGSSSSSSSNSSSSGSSSSDSSSESDEN